MKGSRRLTLHDGETVEQKYQYASNVIQSL